MPTDQETKSQEQAGLSDIQFSAHITEEYTAAVITDSPPEASQPPPIQAEQPPLQEPQPEQAEQTVFPEDEFSKRDREILAALDEMLHKNSAQPPPVKNEKKHTDIRRFAIGTIKRGAGVFSLSITLILMGVTLMCLLISGTQDFSLLIKLSPAAAVIFGVELLLSWVASGRRIHIHIPCVCVNAAIVIGCCILAAVLNEDIAESEQNFSNRSAEAAIYDKTYMLLKHTADISSMDVDVDLILEGGKKRTDESLTTADDISIEIVLNGSYTTPEEFAAECGSVMRVFSDLDIPTDSFRFSAETRLMSFAMDVDGKFQQDFSNEELTELVRYVFIEDYDYIQDLADFTEEAAVSAEAAATEE